jgi:hypothetical protein
MTTYSFIPQAQEVRCRSQGQLQRIRPPRPQLQTFHHPRSDTAHTRLDRLHRLLSRLRLRKRHMVEQPHHLPQGRGRVCSGTYPNQLHACFPHDNC